MGKGITKQFNIGLVEKATNVNWAPTEPLSVHKSFAHLTLMPVILISVLEDNSR